VKASESGRMGMNALSEVATLTDSIQTLSQHLQKPLTLEDDLKPPPLLPEMFTTLRPLLNGSLLLGGKADAFAGPTKEVKAPDLPNFLSVASRVSTTKECLDVLENTNNVVTGLMRRSGDGIVTSQLALKLQALELIHSVFTTVLPTPPPMDATEEVKRTCPWLGISLLGKETQLKVLSLIHGLFLSLGSLSQSVESPTRASDAARALTASAMLAIFDATVRIKPYATGDAASLFQDTGPTIDPQTGEVLPSPEPPWAALAMSELLGEDGGYALDQGVCQDHRPYQRVCATMEIVDPKHSIKRDSVLAYLASTRK